MKSVSFATLLASTFMAFGFTSVAATYDETVNGNLSNNYLSPTPFAFTLGPNTIKGKVTANQDYITFAVPAGSVISSLTLDSYTTSGNMNNVSFFAIAPGSSSPVAPPGANPVTGILGWILFKATNIGPDLLPAIGTAGAGATTFVPPLPAGTYTFWIQDTAQTVNYQFSFNITIPPAPAVQSPKKKTTTKATYKLKGSVTGVVTGVEYRVGNKGSFKPAALAGTAWTINLKKLKAGKNVVTIQAKGPGGTSAPVKTTVTVKTK